jgi:arylsulfatase A-like enzyme
MDKDELLDFKYQRFIKDYLRCVASLDANVGRLLEFLEKEDLLDDSLLVINRK